MPKAVRGICSAAVCLLLWAGSAPAASSRPEAASAVSVDPDDRGAVREVIRRVRSDLRVSHPDFVLVGYTPQYDPAVLGRELKSQFSKKTKIIGISSSAALFDNRGYHKGEKGAVGLLAVSAPGKRFGIGMGDVDEMSPFEAGKTAALAAIKDAGMNIPPAGVIIVSVLGKEEEIIAGVNSVMGDVPVSGGTAGDNDKSEGWSQIFDGRMYRHAVVLAAIYSDSPVGTGFLSGYPASRKRGHVTRSSGRVIHEIDGRPAAAVYNEWAGSKFSDQVKDGGSILELSNWDPLIKYVEGDMGMLFPISIHTNSMTKEGALLVGADVEAGDLLELGVGNAQVATERCRTVSDVSFLRTFRKKKSDVGFGVFAFCAGSHFKLAEEDRRKVPRFVNESISEIPYLGLFTFGEQGHVYGVGNMHQNLGTSLILFGKD